MQRLVLSTIGQSITVQRIATNEIDAHGNPIKQYGEPETVQVYGVAPRTATESTDPGQDFATDTTWDIYAELDADIKEYDLVTLPTGEKTEVIGKPKRWDNAPLLDFLHVSGTHFIVSEKK